LYSGLTERLGVSVSAELLERALTHRSYSYESGGIPTNERLEFLGDSVLGLGITDLLFRDFPDTRALATIARRFSLGEYLRIGKGEESSGGRDKHSILADSLEALIGAIYLEHGMDLVQNLLKEWFGPLIESSHAQGSGIDGKTALQELASERGLSIPIYEIAESGPDHDKSFTAIAVVSQEKFDVGHGKSKREAEQMAARFALAKLLNRGQKQN
jgi:ribonuclease III